MLERLKSIGDALTSVHLDYDILSPKNIDEFKNYKVLIVSSLETMSKTEEDAIREFVRCGGNLYISGTASIRDDNGILKDNFMLNDVMGVDFDGRFDIKPNYVSPTIEDKSIFGDHTKKYPHMMEIDEAIVKIKPHTDGKTLATVTLPISDVEDIKIFSSAISNPPMIETEYPAIYEHPYCDGQVIYSAGVIERSTEPDNIKLFAALIMRLIGDSTVKISAPGCVDFTVYKNKKDSLRIHFLNSQTIFPPIKIDAISASIKIGDKKVVSVKDVSDGKLEWNVKDGMLNLTTNLDVYKMIIVELK